MFRRSLFVALALALGFGAWAVGGKLGAAPRPLPQISGNYLETRTCDIYTGPCFANAQVGLAGQQAIMAWNVEVGSHEGVDLSGLNVVLVVRASDTLGYGGGMDLNPEPIKSIVIVDERATEEQREALTDFVRLRAGKVAGEVVRVSTQPIEMQFDHIDMVAKLQAGAEAHLVTRKLKKGDCVCTNEEIYYPPLAAVENSAPAFTVEGGFAGRGLGQKWTNPGTRSAFLATFAY